MSNERTSVGSGRTSGGFYRRALARLAPVLLFVAPLAAPACSSVPVTGRSQFNYFSVEEDKQLGAQAYAEVIQQSKLKDSGPEFAMVKEVVDRLKVVADDPGFDWEVHLIDDPQTVNAWCMPGGKIAVYTGILPVTQTDVGLAVVLGHEIGHAIARHGTERMSSEQLTGVGLTVLGTVSKTAAQYQEAIAQTANLIAFMPWGRKQELEADHIGLIYMARAGYDPREAVSFWERMASQSQGAPPEFLSTHPSDERRIAEIQKLMPEALEIYGEKKPRP
jgi:predicted Zn-dependent protease